MGGKFIRTSNLQILPDFVDKRISIMVVILSF